MRRPTVSTLVLATVLDVCCVLAFVTIGRHTHHDGDTLAGIWHTGWPFLAGLVIGLVAARYWWRPQAIRPAGLGAWLGAAGVGMVIRVLAGQGTAAAFIVVAFAFLAVLLLGWRAVATVSSHLRGSNHSSRKPKWMQS
jgi:peptidoglycan/LPS O-acetylase OafA/YrhL